MLAETPSFGAQLESDVEHRVGAEVFFVQLKCCQPISGIDNVVRSLQVVIDCQAEALGRNSVCHGFRVDL
ncbi:hypothetical protein OKHIL_34230 [Mycolicibacterium mageritense]|nr:hypothetical protein MTY414_43640 [Mycolicibacterium mageritense]